MSDLIEPSSAKGPSGASEEQSARVPLHDAHRGVVLARQQLSESLEQLSQTGVRTAAMVYRRSKPVLLVASVLGGLLLLLLVLKKPPAVILRLGPWGKPSRAQAAGEPSFLRRALSNLAVALARRLLSKLLGPSPAGPVSGEHTVAAAASQSPAPLLDSGNRTRRDMSPSG